MLHFLNVQILQIIQLNETVSSNCIKQQNIVSQSQLSNLVVCLRATAGSYNSRVQYDKPFELLTKIWFLCIIPKRKLNYHRYLIEHAAMLEYE